MATIELVRRLGNVLDHVLTTDAATGTLIQQMNAWGAGDTCACLVRGDIHRSKPETWKFIKGMEFGLCIYLDAHTYLQNHTELPPLMQGLKGGFRLFLSPTPFIGGPRDFTNMARLVTQWETEGWQTENGVGAVKRILNKMESGGKVSQSMIGKIRAWMYANKNEGKQGRDRSVFDMSRVKASSVELDDPIRLELGWQALSTVKESLPKWVWLYANLSLDPGLMDASLDLNGEMIYNDFTTTKARLCGWGPGLVPRCCLDQIDSAWEANRDNEDDAERDGVVEAGVCFVNLSVQAHWLKLVRNISSLGNLTANILGQAIDELATAPKRACRVWVIDHHMSLGEGYKVYKDWKGSVMDAEVGNLLVTTYQAAWTGWDFSVATVCIFVQQPWLAQNKAHALGQFFKVNEKRDTELRVFDLNKNRMINRIVGDIGSNGAKLRLRLLRSCALVAADENGSDEDGTAYDFEQQRSVDVKTRNHA
jgi:hypothetical protein